MTLAIHAARYFTSATILDVTALVRELAAVSGSASLSLQVTNQTFRTDPHPGVQKHFFIDYTLAGRRAQLTVMEGEAVVIGEPANRTVRQAAVRPAHFTDIIIPTYNNVALTAACFRSIKANTAPGTFRVIWVDNGSVASPAAEDMTAASVELDGVDRICVYLPTNLGFVGAVNEGLRLSDAPSVCFLNNDTVVTPRWLEKLTAVLYSPSSPSLGIVGPMTAYDRPGFCDSPHNLNLHSGLLPEEARQWTPDRLSAELEARYSGQSHPTEFVAFLCALLKRETISRVGYLDTRFDMGMWDDVDYNRSAIASGYSVALALDTCIYHRGRSTFAVVEQSENLDVGGLLSRNKAYLDEKWREYTPGTWTLRKKAKAVMLALYPYQGQGLDAWIDHGAGMTYTAAKVAGVDLDFIDTKSLRDETDLRHRLRGYDLVCFGLKSSYYALGMKIADIAKEQGSRVLVGGYHVTAAPEQLLENPKIDWVMHGESEITFAKFLADPDSFPREFWGEKPADLDALPWMDRSMFRDPTEPVEGWWYPVPGQRRAKMVSVMAARGCPYGCLFCQPIERNHFGLKLRRRSVDSMIAETLMLKEKYQPDCIMIHDDTFLLQRKWIEEFIEKYPQVGLPFWAAGRADGICRDPDLVKGLIGVGWELISVGFESGSQRILDLMKKGTTVEQNLEAARIVHSLGGKLYGNYMLGTPWETHEDTDATIRMAQEINAEMPSFAAFAPYPGSGLGQRCIDEGLSLLDRNSYDRCPSGIKCRGVDYEFVYGRLAGFHRGVRI